MPAQMYTLCDTEVLVKKYGLNKSHNTHDYATCKAMTELYKGIRVLNCRIKISEPDTYYMAQNIIQAVGTCYPQTFSMPIPFSVTSVVMYANTVMYYKTLIT